MTETMFMNYHWIIVNHNSKDNDLEEFDERNIKNYIVCLLFLVDKKRDEITRNKALYYMIDHDWNEMNKECHIMIPG